MSTAVENIAKLELRIAIIEAEKERLEKDRDSATDPAERVALLHAITAKDNAITAYTNRLLALEAPPTAASAGNYSVLVVV